MSNAGLVVYNDSGNLVIDSDLKNLAIRYKGYVTESQGTPSLTQNGVSTSFRRSLKMQLNMRNPVFALRPDSSAAPVSVGQDWSSAANIAMVSHVRPLGGDGYEVEFWYSGSFSYYVFDDPQSENDPGGAGMKVWNAQGELCFSSAFQYMRVRGLLSGDFDSQGPNRGVLYAGEPPGKSYALVQSKVHTILSRLSDPVSHQKYGILAQDSFILRSPGFGIGVTLGTTSFGGYNYDNGFSVPGLNRLLRGSSLVIDVSGY